MADRRRIDLHRHIRGEGLRHQHRRGGRLRLAFAAGTAAREGGRHKDDREGRVDGEFIFMFIAGRFSAGGVFTGRKAAANFSKKAAWAAWNFGWWRFGP